MGIPVPRPDSASTDNIRVSFEYCARDHAKQDPLRSQFWLKRRLRGEGEKERDRQTNRQTDRYMIADEYAGRFAWR